MKYCRNDFDKNKPYKVVEVTHEFGVKYKITQPLKLWLFGYSIRYYDVCEWSLRSKYKMTKYFKNKSEVDSFLKENTKENHAPIEVIVFDSLLN